MPAAAAVSSRGQPEPLRSVGALALACRDLTVRFGSFCALDSVDLDLEPGKIHAIIGQNGAGKTTLARVVAGMLKPQAGEVEAFGSTLVLGDVAASQRAGVEMVHQNFVLPPSFTVAEVLELFSARRRALGIYAKKSLERKWEAELPQAGIAVPPTARIRDLPVETLQALEITRALSARPRLLILDEPTAVLTQDASERLFDRLRQLRNDGVTVIIVLHKLREIFMAAETATVLRGGKVVLAREAIERCTPDLLSRLIIGETSVEEARRDADRAISAIDTEPSDPVPLARARKEAVLAVAGVSTNRTKVEIGLTDVSLEIRAGEIMGVAGVEGNGQRALVAAVAGLTRAASGRIRIGGEDATSWSPAERRRAGLGIVPFDRNTEGVSASSPLWLNVAINAVVLRQASARGALNTRALRERIRSALEQWQVRYRNLDQPAGELSGGNVQRAILARELDHQPKLVIAAQPTRGLDVASTAFVQQTFRDLRDEGAGVLLVSSDLDELLALADRIVVMFDGQVWLECERPFDLARIGRAMVGGEK